jgi:hypothetical protein
VTFSFSQRSSQPFAIFNWYHGCCCCCCCCCCWCFKSIVDFTNIIKLEYRPPLNNNYWFQALSETCITECLLKQRPPVNNDHYFLIPRVIVVHRCGCFSNDIIFSMCIVVRNIRSKVFQFLFISIHWSKVLCHLLDYFFGATSNFLTKLFKCWKVE